MQDGEICCKLYNNGEKLDCLRSPHLYREHPIRINKTNIDWFDTNAIYISCHDLISRIVQCDFDGDKLLVSNNKTLIDVAERNMNGIVPLFYNMGKAAAEQLTSESLFKGLLLAYNGGNIGAPSNDITKIWNSGDITDEKLNAVKWLVMNVNFTIDYAKTLYKPDPPDNVKNIINKYTKTKVPYFFQYAKKKDEENVEIVSESTVDRIEALYPVKKLSFNFRYKNIGRFNYKVLMYNPNAKYNEEIANRYQSTVNNLNFNNVKDERLYNYMAIYEEAKKNIIGNNDINDVLDTLVIYLFSKHRSAKKKAFWTLFGDMLYDNLCNNVDNNLLYCDRCHQRFYKEANNQKYCKKCQGYKKQKTKILMCVDCGQEFEVNARNMTKTRCDECYKEYRKKRIRENVAKYRECH